MEVAVIGGGAAGVFAAIQVKTNFPDARVSLFEQSQKLLAKVKISGGGRCNVTQGTLSIAELAKGYPRGSKPLKKAFKIFGVRETFHWFESRGVALKTEADGRVFPVSDQSQDIIDCLLQEARRRAVALKAGHGVAALEASEGGWHLYFFRNKYPSHFADKVIVATGGSPARRGLEWLESLGHRVVDPVPSLFTFNVPDAPITGLMGISVDAVRVSIPGTSLAASGPMLITHWGLSGPAVLKLSAFGARIFHEKEYTFPVQVNWLDQPNTEAVRDALEAIAYAQPDKHLGNVRPFDLPKRLWHFLLEKGGLPLDRPWRELGKKGANKLMTLLTQDTYPVSGKTTFKEEFVTCGGVSLESVDFTTMQSRVCPGLYFAGEVLDIDGLTGGYNFQAAWTTGYMAGRLG